jgi:phage baseplate assembly protein W
MATKTVQQKKIFSDIPTNLTVHPKKKDLLMITNEEAVKRSIVNLISTNTYERLFQPEIGGNVRMMLFENFSRLTASQIENKIEATILNHEPRAKLIQVKASPDADDNRLVVTVTFAIVGNAKPINLNVVLERQR